MGEGRWAWRWGVSEGQVDRQDGSERSAGVVGEGLWRTVSVDRAENG